MDISKFSALNESCDLFDQSIVFHYNGRQVAHSPRDWKGKGHTLFGNEEQILFRPTMERDINYDAQRINYFINSSPVILEEPIDVECFEDYCAVNDGNHRLIAAFMLDFKSIPANAGGYVDTIYKITL